jgi:hypothetical protein
MSRLGRFLGVNRLAKLTHALPHLESKFYHAVGRAPVARELLPAAMAGLAGSPELPEVAAAHRLLALREVGDVNRASPSVHT